MAVFSPVVTVVAFKSRCGRFHGQDISTALAICPDLFYSIRTMAKKRRKKSGKTLARLKRGKPKTVRVQKGPAVPTDVRVFFNSWPPQFPKDWQVKLAPEKRSETYQADVEGHEAFADSTREASAMWVAELVLLAERGGGKVKMEASMLRWMNEIHARGGFVWEGSTGLRSDDASARKGMIARAKDILGRLAQGKKSASNAKHGRSHDYSADECKIMMPIKYDRRLTNWPMRRVAMKNAGIKKLPGRTWFIEKLDDFARGLGVTI